MRNIMEKLFQAINIISILILFALAANAYFYEIVGPERYERILRWLKIPWSEGEIFKISWVVVAIIFVIYFLRSKFFK